MTDTPQRYFAAYFDVVRFNPSTDHTRYLDGWQERTQFIVVPPVPGVCANYSNFFRHQTARSHKSTWKCIEIADPSLALKDYSLAVDETAAKLVIVPRDPIVVELFEGEIGLYVGNPKKTPWKVIERADKHSRKAFGWRVQV